MTEVSDAPLFIELDSLTLSDAKAHRRVTTLDRSHAIAYWISIAPLTGWRT